MNLYSRRSFLFGCLCFVAGLKLLSPPLASAQIPYPTQPTADAQRNTSSQVRSQISWLQNATRTAPSYGEQGVGQVAERFQSVRGAYESFKQTLGPRQLADGGNALAELDAGLNIIQESFENFRTDVADGRSVNSALRDLCQVLREASQLWLQEFNKTCSRLRTGWH